MDMDEGSAYRTPVIDYDRDDEVMTPLRTPLRSTPLRTPYGAPTPKRHGSMPSPQKLHLHVHHETPAVLQLLGEASFAYMTPILGVEASYGTPFQPRSKSYGSAVSIDNDRLMHWMRASSEVGSGATGSTFMAHFSNVPNEEFLIKTVRENPRCARGPLKDPYGCNDPLAMEYINTVAMASMRSVGFINFVRAYGYFWSRRHVRGHGTAPDTLEYDEHSRPAPFMVLEYLQPAYTNSMYLVVQHEESDVKVWWLVVQLLLALEQAQAFNQFTHYDLHLNNILCVDINAFHGIDDERTTHRLTYGNHTIPATYYAVIIDMGRAYINNRREVGRALGMDATDYDLAENEFWRRHHLHGAARSFSRCTDMRRMMHGVFQTRTWRQERSLELEQEFLRVFPYEDEKEYIDRMPGCRHFRGPQAWAERIMERLA